MKIVILSTFEIKGGAAIACNRLMQALQKAGVDVKLVVRDKVTNDVNVISTGESFIKRKFDFLKFAWERFIIFIHNKFDRSNLFTVSVANTGRNLLKLPEIQEADVINLHWINQGFLSLKDICQLIDTGKPIVWTMHDQWSYTGICHYVGNCTNYKAECRGCFFLKNTSKKDLSTKIFSKKKNIYSKAGKFNFVGCSKWIANCARESALVSENIMITSIPNPIDIHVYKPCSKAMARNIFNLPQDKKLILFGAVKVTDERKGLKFFIDACNELFEHYRLVKENIGIVIFGKEISALKDLFSFPVYGIDYLTNSQDIVMLYNSADIFVTASLEDNLPNTIMESMACGTPCVGFNVGGIPEMIDHKENGYVANYKDSKDLATGISWLLQEADYNSLSENARKKVLEHYCEDVVAKQYIELYKSILK